jgi:hypothetical protein
VVTSRAEPGVARMATCAMAYFCLSSSSGVVGEGGEERGDGARADLSGAEKRQNGAENQTTTNTWPLKPPQVCNNKQCTTLCCVVLLLSLLSHCTRGIIRQRHPRENSLKNGQNVRIDRKSKKYMKGKWMLIRRICLACVGREALYLVVKLPHLPKTTRSEPAHQRELSWLASRRSSAPREKEPGIRAQQSRLTVAPSSRTHCWSVSDCVDHVCCEWAC